MDSRARDDALSGSAGLSGVRSLLYGHASRRGLRRDLAVVLEPGTELGRCTLERAKFKPGRKLTGYYAVEVRQAGRLLRRPVEVTWAVAHAPVAAGGLTPRELAMQEEAGASGILAPFTSLASGGERLGASIRISPLDVEFPHLVRLCTPDQVWKLLAEVYNGAPPAPSYGVTSVRYRPRQRHVLRYDPVGHDPAAEDLAETVFAKLYPIGAARRAARVAASIGQRIEAGSSDIAAARPLTGSEADDVLLYPRVPGRPLSRLLWHRSTQRHLVTAGAILRALHRQVGVDGVRDGDRDPDLGHHDFDAELASIARAAEHLGPLLPSAAARVSRIIDRARNLHELIPPQPPGFAHGDFKTDHLWLGGGRLTLLDYDTCCLAEPALDLGKFLADLSFWYAVADRSGVSTARQRFLSGYADLPPERLARAQLYEGIMLTKLTIRRLRRFDPLWATRTEALTVRAETLLDGAGAGQARRAATEPSAHAPA